MSTTSRARTATATSAIVIALALLAACGDDGDARPPASDMQVVVDVEPSTADAGVASATPDQNVADSAPEPPACEGYGPPPKRDYTITMTLQGQQRTAHVHIPADYDGREPFSLVFNAHGWGSPASYQSQMSHLDEVADTRRFVTVAPQGTGGLMAGWNAGDSPYKATYEKVDDVAFISALIDELTKAVCIDRRRVYCTGFSLGGALCYRLACDLSDRIAAFASVSGPNAAEECKPTRALPMMHFHGTADFFATYAGDGGQNKGAEGSVAAYAKVSGCGPQKHPGFKKGGVSCYTYKGCNDGAEATLCTIKDGGHTWPGGDGWLLGGAVNKDIHASAMILDFFAKHSL